MATFKKRTFTRVLHFAAYCVATAISSVAVLTVAAVLASGVANAETAISYLPYTTHFGSECDDDMCPKGGYQERNQILMLNTGNLMVGTLKNSFDKRMYYVGAYFEREPLRNVRVFATAGLTYGYENHQSAYPVADKVHPAAAVGIKYRMIKYRMNTTGMFKVDATVFYAVNGVASIGLSIPLDLRYD